MTLHQRDALSSCRELSPLLVILTKPKEISLLRKNSELVEHPTNVAGYSYHVFPESRQDTYRTIHLIWTLKQIIIETHPSHLSGSIEDNPDFLRL